MMVMPYTDGKIVGFEVNQLVGYLRESGLYEKWCKWAGLRQMDVYQIDGMKVVLSIEIESFFKGVKTND